MMVWRQMIAQLLLPDIESRRKSRARFCGACFCLWLICLSAVGNAWEEHVYEERTGNMVSRYARQISGDDLIEVMLLEEKRRSRNLCRPDGRTERWGRLDEASEVDVVREGNTLRYSGRQNGALLQKQESIDGDPWFQAMSFSLSRWLKISGKPIRFWTLRPDDLSVHKMMARKEKVERIDVSGKPTQAIQVKVTLSGAFSLFWSATYWFRVADYLFVKYESVHGPPGTEKTVVELVSTVR